MFLLSAMLICTVMYVTLAASLLFATPIEGKVSVVARGTFLGGIPAKDDFVVASPTQAAGTNTLDKLKEAAFGIESAEVVKIASAPTGMVQIDGDSIVVSGMEPGSYTGIVLDDKGERITSSVQLNKAYLAECVSGSCKPGTFVIVDGTKIFGELVNFGTTK
jgi:hypothetical protein